VARLAREAGVEQLIHVSGIGSDPPCHTFAAEEKAKGLSVMRFPPRRSSVLP
jgi:hypothetical protein